MLYQYLMLLAHSAIPIADLHVMLRAVLAITTFALNSRFGLFDSDERNTSKLTRSGVETFWDGTSRA
jgi:hypothetical protein